MIGANSITYIDAANTYVYTDNKKDCKTVKKVTTCSTDTNVYNSDGSYADTYWYTRNKSIILRVDELRREPTDVREPRGPLAERGHAVGREAVGVVV